MELFAVLRYQPGAAYARPSLAGLVTPNGSGAAARPYVPFVASELMGAILATAILTRTPLACRPLFPQRSRASFYRLKRAFEFKSFV